MSTTTLCQVCETASAEYACDRCGAQVCPDHYDDARGLCASCAASGGGDAGPEAGRKR